MKPLLLVDTALNAARQIVGDHCEVALYTQAQPDRVKNRQVIYWPSKPEGLKRASNLAKMGAKGKILASEGNTPDELSELSWPSLLEWMKPRAAEFVILETEEQPALHQSIIDKLHEMGIAMTKSDLPIIDQANIARFLEMHDIGVEIWHDEFYHRTFQNGQPWEDIHTLQLTHLLQNDYGFRKVTPTIVDNAVEVHGHRMMRNEPKQWLNSLVWDGIPRIADLFVDCFGAEPSPYISAVGHNFLVGMVARIYQPGCQNDHMVVLEGPQNAGKTSALRILGGRWYVELSESITSKDFLMTLNGRMIVEIAELDSFNKAEVTRIKQVISCPIDAYRLPYARRGGDYARTCVFVGTTNDDTYLRDPTGARRFWPVKCGKIDLPLIKDLRNQLFAEAVICYKNKDSWHLVPADEAHEIQESRRDKDEYENLLHLKLMGTPFITLGDAALLLGITADKLDKRTQSRIITALKKANYQRDQRRIMGVMTRGWELLNGDSGTGNGT